VTSGYEILKALNLRQKGPVLVSCPQCGRAEVNIISLASLVEQKLQNIDKPIRVAVMGCVVNGPGEAKDADIGVACGKGKAVLFKKGIQMATINTAEHFGLTREIGMIAPGRHADLVLVTDLNDFRADLVISRGEVAVEDGKLLTDHPQVRYPDWALHSVHLPHMLTPENFVIPALRDFPHTAHVIGIIEHQAPTRHLLMTVIPEKGEILADMKRDVMKLALIERHHNTGRVQMGLVQGFGFKNPCAVASTVAHDAHNMIVVGTDGENMAIASNHLAAMGGGQIVVKEGKVNWQSGFTDCRPDVRPAGSQSC